MINLLNPDGTFNENAGAVRRPRPPARSASGSSPTWRRRGCSSKVEPYATRAELHRPQQDADRAVPVGPVVRPDGTTRRTPACQQAMDAVTAGPGQDPPRALRQELPRLARREARLVHQPAALVGPSDPDLVLRRRCTEADLRTRLRRPRRRRLARGRGGRLARSAPRPTSRPTRSGPGIDAATRTPTSSTPGSARPSGRTRRSAGPRRRPSWRSTTRRASSRRPATSSRSGWPGW